jgi:hypothetical protein
VAATDADGVCAKVNILVTVFPRKKPPKEPPKKEAVAP